MSRKNLSNKEIKELNEHISFLDLELDKKDNVVIEEDKEKKTKIILVNEKPWFFYHKDRVCPTLKLILEKDPNIKSVYVDEGAVSFMVKGADLMRPGITKIDEKIQRQYVIVIRDAKHEKPLAIGIALYSADDMEFMDEGKVVENIHYVGDDIWKKE